jgi:hypothetical protein
MFHDLSQAARQGLSGADQIKWLVGLALEHDNLSEALGWLFEHAPDRAAETASGL